MSQPQPDRALLRFLLAGKDTTTVLNGGPPEWPCQTGSHPGGEGLAARLMQAARALVADTGGIAYGEIAGSAAFAGYRALARTLQHFDPFTLSGRGARTAFWINLYNALVIDAVISFAVRETVREVSGFFHRAAYQVGPFRLALDEIEHGILRGNQAPYRRFPPPFPAGDPRAAFNPGELDPRIHFALNCGARSCPPVAFYEAARLDDQLDAAAVSFINGEGVRPAGDRAMLSPIFQIYAADFGGPVAVIDWVMRYLEDPRLRERLHRGEFAYAEYDWTLNAAGDGPVTESMTESEEP